MYLRQNGSTVTQIENIMRVNWEEPLILIPDMQLPQQLHLVDPTLDC